MFLFFESVSDVVICAELGVDFLTEGSVSFCSCSRKMIPNCRFFPRDLQFLIHGGLTDAVSRTFQCKTN